MSRVSTPDRGGRGGGMSQGTYASGGGGGGGGNTPGSGSQGCDSVTTEAILSRLGKAKEIENQLEMIAAEQKAAKRSSGGGGGTNSNSNSNSRPSSPNLDQRSQALRLQLCEVLSDVILNDSQLAHANDAVGRLWKNCFYGRINDIRSRIAKEKSRARKRATTGGGDGGEGAEAAKRMAGDLDRQLKQFLKEAIQLYRYIVERYLKELMPFSQSQNSNGGSDEEEEERERSVVVVASLYRMHIHLGDLYRYSSQHKHAEECYLKSAKLAPGTGNPFNQLAVVAQQSQDAATVVALYYYARSLMATREPFETSRSNLARLFESNERWLAEHAREDGAAARGIVGASTASGGGANNNNAREWRRRERAAANRRALARTVDLQRAFFRGVSLDGYADGRIDLEGLRKKMAGLRDELAGLIGQASFGEGLLCKVVAILAFSTLGASNHGKLIGADGFCAKRKKDPKWNEGIVMTNQALAFSFFLRVCSTLAKDVDAVLSKKEAHKLGAIRSLSPLLLGFRFAISLYEGCDWFHGLPFFPSAGEAGNSELESSSIHKLCKQSHMEFWQSIASMTNHIDTLLGKRSAAHRGDDIMDVKEFAEFRGYVPFTCFLDANDATRPSSKNGMKYATTEEVIEALSEKKNKGGVQGIEAETRLKINIILSIAESNTDSNGAGDGQYFLSKNPETNEREFVSPDTAEEKSVVFDNGNDEESQSEMDALQPDQASNDMDALQPDQASNDMAVDNATGRMEEQAAALPLKISYSDKGMALLTPAALLGGLADKSQNKPTLDVVPMRKGAALKSPSFTPVDSIMAPTISTDPSKMDATVPKGVDSLLTNLFPSNQQQEPLSKAPLPPPPGFSAHNLPEQRAQLPLPIADPSTTGISLAQFAVPAPPRRAEQNVALPATTQSAPPGMMPQAGPSGYPVPNMFETMNPFAQAPLPSFNNNFISANPSMGSNQSRLLNTSAHGNGVSLQQHTSHQGGLDPTLNFLLNNNDQIPTPGQPIGSFNSLNLLVPPPLTASHEPEDPSESIMKFLFEPGNDTSARAGQPLYANRGGHPPAQPHGMPQTKNPFAT